MNLAPIDWIVMLVYFLFVLGIGFFLKSRMKSSTDFFLAGRSIPAWVCGLAFISANLGAQEVIGMAASGAKYGIATSHFYWVGAIPAMVFVGVFMMPFYYGSRARSVPEYLRLRFDEKTRAFNALTFAVMTVFSSGVSMYAMAKLIGTLHLLDRPFAALGWPREWQFHTSMLISAVIVLGYIFLGGLTSAIYNEVLQFFLIVLGFLPLILLGMYELGGWSGLHAKAATGAIPEAFLHSWQGMSDASKNPLGVEWFGMVMGLGFVLSFGYWCTDFLVVQRAMAADSMSAARRTPLIAALPKMVFPFLVILPGLISLCIVPNLDELKAVNDPAAVHQVAALKAGHGIIPAKLDAKGNPVKNEQGQVELDYDLVIPNLLLHYFPPGLLGLGLTALLASFMSGMAGNVTAFNTVWTYDIYQSYIRPNASDEHYLAVGRWATEWGMGLSILAAYIATRFNNIMDVLQLVFAFVNAPVFATFLLGMFWKRATGHGAFTGLVSGTTAAALHHGLTLPAGSAAGVKGGWIAVLTHYPSEMAQNFWTAIFAWSTCFLVTLLVSLATKAHDEKTLVGLVYSLTERPKEDDVVWWQRPGPLGVCVLALTALLNLVFY